MVSLSGFDGLIYSIGFLVGWPVVMFLIAEPLRNLGKYTFADVVAFRLRQGPVRVAASIGSLAVVSFYLIAQMVGAGTLIRLLFGFEYETAIVLVGVVMLAYVLFGGMMATTWVQIIKAVLLLSGAFLLAVMALSRFSFSPLALFRAASDQYGAAVLAPGRLVSNPFDAMSLGLALMLGTAGLPHILMRFYTVQGCEDGAPVGELRDGVHRVLLPADVHSRVRRDGARGAARDSRDRRRRQHGRAAAREGRRRRRVSRIHLGRGVRHDPRGRRGSHARRRGHALARSVGERRAPWRLIGPRRIESGARRDGRARRPRDRPRNRLQGTERRVHGGAGVCDRREREFSGARAVDVLAQVHDARRRR